MNNSIAAYNRGILLKILLCYALVIAGVAYRPLMYLAFLFSVLFLVIEREEWLVTAILISLVHISPIFKLTAGSTSLFTYIELIAIVKYVLLNRKIQIAFLIPWLFYAIYVLIGDMANYASGYGLAVADLVKTITVPLLFYFMARALNCKRLKEIAQLYILGVTAGAIISLLSGHIPNMSTFIRYKEVHLASTISGFISSTRFSGLMGDPNYFSIHLILAIAICAVWWSRKEIGSKEFFIIYAFMSILGGMTSSKSFFLMLIAVTAMIVWILFRSREYGQAVLFSGVIAVASVLLLTGHIDVFDSVLTRFQSVFSGSKDLTTGRTALWKQYLAHFGENPLKTLLGNGIGKGFSFAVAAHNTYIDFIDLVGVIGISLFIISILQSMRRFGNIGRRGNNSLLLLFVLVVMYFNLSMFYSNDLPFQLLLALGFVLVRDTNDTKPQTSGEEAYAD